MVQVARGRLSKQIAHDIGIAEATVKEHHSRAMQKMKAGSLPELGQMADKLKLVPTRCNASELYALRHALFRAVGSGKRVCHCSAIHGPSGSRVRRICRSWLR
jgi:hypothetical protein